MFPQLVQAGIQVQATRRGSSLDSNIPPGAAQAYQQIKHQWNAHTLQANILNPNAAL